MSARKTIAKLVGGAAVIALGASAAIATDVPPPRPAVVDAIYQCRDIVDNQARLACFDARVGEMAAADQRRDIMFADREQVKETRRGLFGFSGIKIFGGGGDGDDEQIEEITAKIAAVRYIGRNMSILLDDGARWVQTDDRTLPLDAKAGMEIKIRRAALGSYFANINGMRAIRVKRAD
ncbi:hypothetical protein FSZ31_02220 [Sphingorhabdus soli]|uniref:Uncharacterized protein n=1 Tax=Flavisphingopyxis soli TaxID=2601267 RepID=A0A5C6UN61_9SPHN|nr:hypothetical protein [Sphingorhabdus soli]TXC73581.1 hypothetical protein FSZ31_02220 [Sphingorhabdus soli]